MDKHTNMKRRKYRGIYHTSRSKVRNQKGVTERQEMVKSKYLSIHHKLKSRKRSQRNYEADTNIKKEQISRQKSELNVLEANTKYSQTV